MAETLRRHWPEYAIEALFLAAFVVVAGVVSAWIPAAGGLLPDSMLPLARRGLAGAAIGLMLMAMVYSPWGRRSGSHLNPAITLAYLRLGKIGRWDALFYLLAQVGAGLAAAALLRGGVLWPAAASPSLLPPSVGPTALWVGFVTELALSAAAMLLILFTSNHASWLRWTGVLYGVLVMLIVACAEPLSGFGMNLARLLALSPHGATEGWVWIGLLPPLLGAQLAVETYRLLTGRSQVLCAKLAHNTHGRCIFRCQHPWQTRALAMEALRRQAAGGRRSRSGISGR